MYPAYDIQFRRDMGERLFKARKHAGLSQAKVAHLLGIPRTAVSLVERGTRKVDAMELSILAELYGYSMDALAGRAAPRGGG